MADPRYVVLANPDSLRWRAYEPELRAFWAARGAVADIVVVPWRDVIAAEGRLDALPAFDRPAVVRLESPGRDWEVSRMLLRVGSLVEDEATEIDWLGLEYERGALVRPGLFYAGFRHVLRGLHASFGARPHLRPMACPLQVFEMFDKNASGARLAAAGVPVPPSFVAPADPATLLGMLRHERYEPAYVKLNTGSSASAIAVVRSRDTPRATSSIVIRGGAFYSTRRLVQHASANLDLVLAFLIREGVCVQRGIRMAQMEGQNFDIRVVVICGAPAFTIFRLSPNPMTNLHLGGHRGDLAACRAAIPPRAWLDGLDACVGAAAQFPRCAVVGVDLLFELGYRRHFVLEVNAFGDFFPNLTDEQGRSVHRVEIEATAMAEGMM
jgi:glutathione synthase/RimK-type ligase-like ATP-grasp enzyme